jgi:hypothetical protein
MRINLIVCGVLIAYSVGSVAISNGADLSRRPSVLFDACPKVVTTEPPPCDLSHPNENYYALNCTYPATHWFEAKNGFGCAGMVHDVKLEMVRAPFKDNKISTRYRISYTLYTGNGFQKDNSRLHIDAWHRNGTVPDIVPPLELDLSNCYYSAGRKFRLPSGLSGAPISLDFTQYYFKYILIRVDPAENVGRNEHC